MTKKLLTGLVLAVALLIPTVARAHGGHLHKVIGTVSSIDGNRVVVKGTDGKDVTVMLNAKTRIRQGKTRVEAGALTIGTRLVAEGTEAKGIVTATSVQVGTAPAAARR